MSCCAATGNWILRSDVVVLCLSLTLVVRAQPGGKGKSADLLRVASPELYEPVACIDNITKQPMNCTRIEMLGILCKQSKLFPAQRYGFERMMRLINIRQELLPGYVLQVDWHDDECDIHKAIDILTKQLENHPFRYSGLLQGAQVASELLSLIAFNNHLPHYGFHSQTSMTNRERAPAYWRTVPPFVEATPGILSLFQNFGWRSLGILFNVKLTGRGSVEEEANIFGDKMLEWQYNVVFNWPVHDWAGDNVKFSLDASRVARTIRSDGVRILVWWGGGLGNLACRLSKDNISSLQLMSVAGSNPIVVGSQECSVDHVASWSHGLIMVGPRHLPPLWIGRRWQSPPVGNFPLTCLPQDGDNAGNEFILWWYKEMSPLVKGRWFAPSIDVACLWALVVRHMLFDKGIRAIDLRSHSKDILQLQSDWLNQAEIPYGITGRKKIPNIDSVVAPENGDPLPQFDILQVLPKNGTDLVRYGQLPVKSDLWDLFYLGGWPGSGFDKAALISTSTNNDTFDECSRGHRREVDVVVHADGRMSWKSLCKPCFAGYYWAYAENGEPECKPCLAGYESSAGSEECSVCPAGKFSLAAASECSSCESGRYALAGMSVCEQTKWISAQWSECSVDCGGGARTRSVKCTVDINGKSKSLVDDLCIETPPPTRMDCNTKTCPIFIWTPLIIIGCLFAISSLLIGMVLKRLIYIEDLTIQAGQVGIRTAGRHWLLTTRRGIPARIAHTKNPTLEGMFRLRCIGARDLKLMDANGNPVRQGETSIGEIRLSLWHGLRYSGLIVSVPIWVGVCCLLAIAVSMLAGSSPHDVVLAASFGILIMFPVAIVVRVCRRSVLTRLTWMCNRYKVTLFCRQDSDDVPLAPAIVCPSEQDGDWAVNFTESYSKLNSTRTSYSKRSVVESGAKRAVSFGQVIDLLDFFDGFIRNRTMYYLVSNIIVPLTANLQLSFAEMVGSKQSDFFVSHSWGHVFRDTVSSLREHGKSILAKGLTDASSLRHIHYWICSFANNQHHIAEELGSDWRQSSFYKTLYSGSCLGTVMIIDKEVQPLRRSWCLFELVQTWHLKEKKKGFTGLSLVTPAGVLGEGGAPLDVVLSIAEAMQTVKVQDASASNPNDKAMIDRFVEENGGFDAMNSFIRNEILEALIAGKMEMEQRISGVASSLGSKFVDL